MPSTCSAHGCKNRAKAGSGIHFFRFPVSEPHKLESWVKAVCRKGFIPNKNSRLCSQHFKNSDFYENPGGSYKVSLKSDAIPSVFEFSIHSTLIPTKLFVNDTLIKRKKSDSSATASSSVCNETTEDLVVEEVLNDSFEQIKPLLITPTKYKNRVTYVSSPRKKFTMATPTKLKKKIKLLQQKVRRQNKVINNLKDLLSNLRKQGMLNSECEDLMLNKFDGMSAELFKNQLKNLEC